MGLTEFTKVGKTLVLLFFSFGAMVKSQDRKGREKNKRGRDKNMTNYQNRELYKLQAAADVQRRARTGARKR